jgi:hypothetical protein
MQTSAKPASRIKVILLWLLVVGNLTFWIGFWVWRNHNEATPPSAEESAPDFVRSIFYLFVGGFFLVIGVGAYLGFIFTNGLTFNFSQPVFKNFKGKKYLANIVAPLFAALGLGFALSAFVTPALQALGFNPSMASILPVLGMVAILQILQIFVLIWSPLEKRVITRRLAAKGIVDAQLQSAILVGLSDPTRSSFSKFGGIEEDMGALWLDADRLIYWGDSEQFSITRDQLLQLEQKADSGSTTMLVGATHPILHVQLPDGTQRQIRLHVEAVGTMAKKRKALDQLANSIIAWHGKNTPPPVPA